MKGSLIINGTEYQYQQLYLQEDELWECAYVDSHGNMAEVDSGILARYDESLAKAQKDLEILVKDNGLEFGVNNEVVLWKNLDEETRRKILVFAKKIQSAEMSEWHYHGADFENWRRSMHDYTGVWLTLGQYYQLYKE